MEHREQRVPQSVESQEQAHHGGGDPEFQLHVGRHLGRDHEDHDHTDEDGQIGNGEHRRVALPMVLRGAFDGLRLRLPYEQQHQDQERHRDEIDEERGVPAHVRQCASDHLQEEDPYAHRRGLEAEHPDPRRSQVIASDQRRDGAHDPGETEPEEETEHEDRVDVVEEVRTGPGDDEDEEGEDQRPDLPEFVRYHAHQESDHRHREMGQGDDERRQVPVVGEVALYTGEAGRDGGASHEDEHGAGQQCGHHAWTCATCCISLHAQSRKWAGIYGYASNSGMLALRTSTSGNGSHDRYPPSDPRKGVGSGLLDDGAGRTLVDACAAVDAFVLENHGYVLDEDRILRAHIRARTACDAFACFHGRHMLHLREHTWRADIMVRFERRSPDETAPWGSQRLTVAMPSSGT